MTTQQIVSALEGHKGQFLTANFVSSVQSLAAHRDTVVCKHTTMCVCSGISFENRKDIRDAIESGERGEVQSLPWGVWAQFPYVISHKGQDYIRLYLPSEAQKTAGFGGKPVVVFTANGKEISREQAIALCGSKAQAKENESGCMTVKACNLALLV